jgi:hypothetical protein
MTLNLNDHLILPLIVMIGEEHGTLLQPLRSHVVSAYAAGEYSFTLAVNKTKKCPVLQFRFSHGCNV